jgi:hypothetical protein
MKGLAAFTVIAAVQTHAAGVPAQQLKPSDNPVALEIPFASPNAAGVTVASAPGAWGGARSGSEPTLSDRVVDYKINATLDRWRIPLAGRRSSPGEIGVTVRLE